MATHAMAVTGNGNTAAATKTAIGNPIILPAGGPWRIHHIWAQVAKVTTIPNEGIGGTLFVDSLTGDLTPDPAPGKYPALGSPVSESADSAISVVPLNLWPVDWEASGKAQIQLSYANLLAITTAPKVAAGIIFGDSIPEVRPLKFCDVVTNSWASANETQVGTITLAEKATRIVGIMANLMKGDAPTAGEEIMATIRLDSADILLPPAQYPCAFAYNASDGTAVGQASNPQAQFIPVDIPVVGGARIDVFATTTRSVTDNADIAVHIAYE